MLFRQTNAQIDTLHYNIETITRNPKQNSSNKKNNPNKRRKSFKDPQKLKKKNKTE